MTELGLDINGMILPLEDFCPSPTDYPFLESQGYYGGTTPITDPNEIAFWLEWNWYLQEVSKGRFVEHAGEYIAIVERAVVANGSNLAEVVRLAAERTGVATCRIAAPMIPSYLAKGYVRKDLGGYTFDELLELPSADMPFVVSMPESS